MLILGIDTSCDDTSAALLDINDGRSKIITNVVSGQAEIHTRFGGIVPELASRQHIRMIWPVVQEALGNTGLDAVDAVAVCHGPGLIGSLLVGCSFAKAASYAADKKAFVGVNHLEGHLLSAFLEGPEPEFPFISLIVSGGHSCLYRVDGYMDYTELGRTRDDAAGEAYDKVAKLLGLGYPGGPAIDALANKGDPKAVKLPRPYMPNTLDMSFSGLKTAVKLVVQAEPSPRAEDVAAAFQASVSDVLVRKTEWAIRKTRIKRVSISGGVAANSALRSKMQQMALKDGITLYLPPVSLCTDNAAMIALAGFHHLRAGHKAGLDLNPKAYLPL